MPLFAVWCSALLCRTKPTGEDDDAAKPRRPENTKRETQVLAASIAETTKEKEATHNDKLTRRRKRRERSGASLRAERSERSCRRSGAAPCCAGVGTFAPPLSRAQSTLSRAETYRTQKTKRHTRDETPRTQKPKAAPEPKNRATRNSKRRARTGNFAPPKHRRKYLQRTRQRIGDRVLPTRFQQSKRGGTTLSSPAAKCVESVANGAFGGRVQRLVVLRVCFPHPRQTFARASVLQPRATATEYSRYEQRDNGDKRTHRATEYSQHEK